MPRPAPRCHYAPPRNVSRIVPKELAKARPCSCQGPRQGAAALPPMNVSKASLALAKVPLCSSPRRDLVHTRACCLAYAASDFSISMYAGDPRPFAGHEEVLSFLKDFAADFRLTELTRFESEVVRVVRVYDGEEARWVVEWKRKRKRRGGLLESAHEVFDAVICVMGISQSPEFQRFKELMVAWNASANDNYRFPGPFQGQDVVLIRSGASAFDISRDISSCQGSSFVVEVF
ncbi:hypothetical protein Syun_012568 [Stephania yunnanensis]|uniref:Flavin-containing monooxygenase n=1 Tax=Stephania yunnanensis TaxID=152371 RepID=A0AAP0PFF7_9MAGN